MEDGEIDMDSLDAEFAAAAVVAWGSWNPEAAPAVQDKRSTMEVQAFMV